MSYTAIIKDGGLFIPNVFADLDEGGSLIVQVELDLDEVRAQLETNDALKAVKTVKKSSKRPAKRAASKQVQNPDTRDTGKGHIGELAGLDDRELSEIIKAYMNDEPVSSQISLENL
ncbi:MULTISPECIES: hypothetical protein [unclassified Psychrobacter]|uniref:hypothetical protein n=1 Tax=unclassified Psychrobacter TaxID=196806 RepID=UPI003FCEE8FE